jgi:NADH-quinone oxidoreductase subunit K
MTPDLSHYLVISGLLFSLGLACVIVRRNLIIIFMGLEMMLSAANLALVAFSRFRLVDGLPNYHGQAMVFFVITVAAAEVAVGLAIIVAIFRLRRRLSIDDLSLLKW